MRLVKIETKMSLRYDILIHPSFYSNCDIVDCKECLLNVFPDVKCIILTIPCICITVSWIVENWLDCTCSRAAHIGINWADIISALCQCQSQCSISLHLHRIMSMLCI